MRGEQTEVHPVVLFLLSFTWDLFKMRADVYRGMWNPKRSHSGIISVTPHQLVSVKVSFISNKQRTISTRINPHHIDWPCHLGRKGSGGDYAKPVGNPSAC